MAKELIYRVKIVYDSDQAAKGAQTIDRTQEQAKESVDETTAAIRRQQEAQEQTTKSARGYNRVQSNANQTLFTFGDLLNDSQQFQFGFAQGTRAIGNNIGFAAEQFSQISQRTGGFKASIKALGASLLGPGGAILAINAVVTAITVFGDKLFETEKATEDLNEELDQAITNLKNIGAALAEVRGISDGTIGQIQELRSQQQRLNQDLQTNKNIIDELTLSQEELARLQELRNLRDADGIDLTAEQTKELQQLARRQEQNAGVVEEYRKENEGLRKEIEDLKDEEQDLIRQAREVAQAQTDASEAVDVFALRAQDAERQITQTTNTIEALKKASEDLGFVMPEVSGTSGVEAAEGSIADLQMRIQAFENLRSKLDPMTEGFRQLTDAIREAKKELSELNQEGEDSGDDTKDAWEDVDEVIARAGAQAIVTADNISQAADATIDSIIAEIVAYSIRSAVRDLPFPTNLLAAAGAAAAGRGLAELIPDFGGSGGGASAGGVASGGGGGFVSNTAQRSSSGGGGGGSRSQVTAGVQSQAQKQPQPIVIEGDINTVATAFKVRKGEAKIRAQQQ